MNRKWVIAGVAGVVALISGGLTLLIWSKMHEIPAGMQSAPDPSPGGIAQLGGALGTFGLSAIISIVTAVVNLWHGTVTPVVPNPGPNNPDPNTLTSILPDLIQAFPAFIADRHNSAKAMRFWFDLIQFGIAFEPNPDIQKWLQEGSEIMLKKFIPVPPAK